MLSQWIFAILHVVVLIASGGHVHVGYTEGIWSKSRTVYSIIKYEHGLMPWPLGFENGIARCCSWCREQLTEAGILFIWS